MNDLVCSISGQKQAVATGAAGDDSKVSGGSRTVEIKALLRSPAGLESAIPGVLAALVRIMPRKSGG